MKAKSVANALLAVASLFSSSVYAQLPPAYDFTLLPFVPTDINNPGQIVGGAFLWDNQNLIPLGGGGNALSINNPGQIAGYTGDGENAQAVVWNNAVPTPLQPLSPGGSSEAWGINNAGRVVGVASHPVLSNVPVVWDGGVPTPLALPAPVSDPGVPQGQAYDINNSGQIAGQVFTPTGLHAVIWNGNTVTDLTPNRDTSEARAINDQGQAVGFGLLDDATFGAFLWSQGTLTDLDKLAGGFTNAFAYDINNAGLIVGQADIAINEPRAAIWNGGVHDLNSLVDPSVIADGWVLQLARAINERGQIVGAAYNLSQDTYTGFLLTPVPEPETYAMFLAGLGIIGLTARKRIRSRRQPVCY